MQEIPLRFKEMADEEVVKFAKRGDIDATEYLLEKYSQVIQNCIKPYFLVGAEKEDLMQEGMIGLYEAIKDYNARKSSFRSFADLCIRRQVVTAIRAATRQKQIPLNSSISINDPLYEDDSNLTLADVLISDNTSNPEKKFILEETMKYIKEELKQILTDLEWRVFLDYLEEKSYREIASEINRREKAVDNALTRVKRKAASKIIAAAWD